MKCRAAVLHKMGAPEPYSNSRPIEIEEIELDPPGEGEVLIKVAAAGLCRRHTSLLGPICVCPQTVSSGIHVDGVARPLCTSNLTRKLRVRPNLACLIMTPGHHSPSSQPSHRPLGTSIFHPMMDDGSASAAAARAAAWAAGGGAAGAARRWWCGGGAALPCWVGGITLLSLLSAPLRGPTMSLRNSNGSS